MASYGEMNLVNVEYAVDRAQDVEDAIRSAVSAAERDLVLCVLCSSISF